jgi:hypothetical protein
MLHKANLLSEGSKGGATRHFRPNREIRTPLERELSSLHSCHHSLCSRRYHNSRNSPSTTHTRRLHTHSTIFNHDISPCQHPHPHPHPRLRLRLRLRPRPRPHTHLTGLRIRSRRRRIICIPIRFRCRRLRSTNTSTRCVSSNRPHNLTRTRKLLININNSHNTTTTTTLIIISNNSTKPTTTSRRHYYRHMRP